MAERLNGYREWKALGVIFDEVTGTHLGHPIHECYVRRCDDHRGRFARLRARIFGRSKSVVFGRSGL